MPVYDYRCGDCGHEFVIIESLEEHEKNAGKKRPCPECEGGKVERVISGVNIQTARKS